MFIDKGYGAFKRFAKCGWQTRTFCNKREEKRSVIRCYHLLYVGIFAYKLSCGKTMIFSTLSS